MPISSAAANQLTPREREVKALVVDDRANKVIAIDLGLSERTVEIHRANVMEKMREGALGGASGEDAPYAEW